MKPHFVGDLQVFHAAFQNRWRAPTLRKSHRCSLSRMAGVLDEQRNVLYLIIGALVVALGVLGYNLYQAKKEPDGLQINIGPSRLKIQNE
jgi:hypothetical protein